jgi:long-chain fatty acid transport protein
MRQEKMSQNKRKNHLLLTCLLFAFVQTGLGDGLRNTPEGAAAIGVLGGYRAFADDANATIHNSANLVDLKQPMLQINTTFGYGNNQFHSAFGNDKTENPFYAIPGFSIAAPLKDGKYAIGFSTYVPYGRSVQWGSDGFFANNGLPYEGSMAVMDFTPNVAMRLSDSVSIGIGADIYYGQVEQRQFLYGLGGFGLPDGTHTKITGDGTALGWNAAITWKMTDKQRLAATYRSPFAIKYKGDNEYSFGGNTFLESNVHAEIEYPSVIALAYGVELTDTLHAELDVEWLEFSVYQNLTINDSNLGPLTSPQKLKNTWTIGIGGEWDFAEHWTARAGYKYLQNPTPDSTYSPLGPDEDQGVISFGLGYENEKHVVDLGYAVGLFGGRNVTGSANSPDGDYDYSLQVVSLSYGYKF